MNKKQGPTVIPTETTYEALPIYLAKDPYRKLMQLSGLLFLDPSEIVDKLIDHFLRDGQTEQKV